MVKTKCNCGFPLKKKEHLLCYKCFTIKYKGIESWFAKRRKKGFRWLKLRNKINWDKKVQNTLLTLNPNQQICSYQPAIYSNYTGSVNICDCPCNGNC